MIRPFSPEPFTCDKLIPLSFAICFANGEAKILSPEVVSVFCGAATGADAVSVASAGVGAEPPFL